MYNAGCLKKNITMFVCLISQKPINRFLNHFFSSENWENIHIRGDYQEIFTDKISPEISETLVKIIDFRETMAKRQSPEGGPGVPEMVLQTDR